MHVAVVLAKDAMNALQKVSPEADRAGQIHSSPPFPEGNMGRATKACALHWSKRFPPVQINLLTENTSHEQIPAAHHDDESAHGILCLSRNFSVGC
jgi:hypothetical protein